MENKSILGTVLSLVIVVALLGSFLAPTIAAYQYETVTIENDASLASWIRYDYGNADYDLEITTDGTNITIGNQTGTADDMILYADEKSSVMSIDGGLVIVNGYGETPIVAAADTVTITKNNGSIVITDGTDTIVSATAPAWAYYPDENGTYTFFDADVENVGLNAGDNTAFAGSYAGVMAYNDFVAVPYYGGINLTLNADISNNVINSVSWGVPSVNNALSLTPSNLDLSPLDPSIINSIQLNQGMGLMSVPTPTYVDTVTGVWGFDIIEGTDAKIVSYSGTSQTNIEIPATVSYDGITYDVVELGKGTYDSNIIDSSITGTLVIPDSVVTINNYAFTGCTGLTGTLVIPDSVTEIWSRCIYNTGITGLILGAGVEQLRPETFLQSSVTEVLNLSSLEVTTTSYGLTADEVRSDVPAIGYIAPLSYSTSVQKEGVAYDLIAIIPLVMIISIVTLAVYIAVNRYD